jgi:hypothetical protein
LHICIRPVSRALVLLAIMDIRAHPLSFKARSHAVQCLQVQLIVGLYWNAACRWPQHCLRNRVCVPEVVLVTLTKWLGIGRRYLSHIMTEREQLAGNIVASIPIKQGDAFASRSGNPATGKFLTQDNRSLLVQADQVKCVYPCQCQ